MLATVTCQSAEMSHVCYPKKAIFFLTCKEACSACKNILGGYPKEVRYWRFQQNTYSMSIHGIQKNTYMTECLIFRAKKKVSRCSQPFSISGCFLCCPNLARQAASHFANETHHFDLKRAVGIYILDLIR